MIGSNVSLIGMAGAKMSPVFACFPVCLTFVALGILALLVFITGMVGPGPGATADEDESPTPSRDYEQSGPPPWWVIALIFTAVAAAFFFLNWVGADW